MQEDAVLLAFLDHGTCHLHYARLCQLHCCAADVDEGAFVAINDGINSSDQPIEEVRDSSRLQ